MRLTIINQFYAPDLSPTAHLAASLAKHRAGQGDDVTVIASRGGYVEASEDAQSESHRTLTIHRLWTPRLGKGNVLKRCIDYGVFYLLAMLRMVSLKRQDVVISLTTPPYIAWTAVLHKLRYPRAKLILWNMDCYPELAERSDKLKTGGFLARVMRAMNRALFRRIDHLVCLDTAMVDLLMPQYAPQHARKTRRHPRELPVSVIPNWENASFFPASADPPAWEGAPGLGLEGKFVVLYLGNMGYGHRFETVLDAASALESDDIMFLFIGGGARFEPVKEEVERRGLSNVILRGYVPKEETPSVMACADCALITLRDEILGVMSPSKLHSNLAMGLPILYVGPATSNVDDAIVNHDCGISLRHGSAAELAQFIRELANDRERLDALRAKARAAFDAAYNDGATLPQFDAIIEGLLQDGQSSQPSDSQEQPAPEQKAWAAK